MKTDIAVRHLFLKILRHKLVLFLLVCGLNTLFGYGMFALLVFLKLHYTLAMLLATIAGILFNFKTTGGIVFNNKNNGLLFRFILVYSIGYLCNIGGIAVLKMWGVNAYYAAAVLILPVAILMFFLNRKFVFASSTNVSSAREFS